MTMKFKKGKAALNKIITVVVAIAILFSAIGSIIITGALMNRAGGEIWDGSIKKPLGDGSTEAPYLISNGAELAWYITLPDNEWKSTRRAKLTADIYLNDISKINWKTGAVEAGYNPNTWLDHTTIHSDGVLGNLDGAGHIIYGMYFNNDSSSANVGLFPHQHKNYGLIVKNLGIDNVYISTGGVASAILADGDCQSEKIILNCFVGKNVNLKGKHAGSAIAQGENISIDKFYSLATVSATNYYGVIGDSWGVKVSLSNAYALGVTTSKTQNSIPCTNVYVTDTTGSQGAQGLNQLSMQGLDVFTNTSKMPDLAGCDAFKATEGYPQLKVFDNVVNEGGEDEKNPVWDGSIAKPEGDGSSANPYLISNGAELAWYITLPDNEWKSTRNAKLTADIYLNDISKIDWKTGAVSSGYLPNNWLDHTGIHPDGVLGSLDGDGYIIYGMYYNKASSGGNVGLFPHQHRSYGITVKNLGIDNAYIVTGGVSSAIIADGDSSAAKVIVNSFVGKNVTLKGSHAGSAVAQGENITIDKFYSLADVSATRYYGVIGDSWGQNVKLSNAFVSGTFITSKTANSVACTNVYVTDTTGSIGAEGLEDSNMKGLDALTNAAKMPNLAGCEAFEATESYPKLKGFEGGVPDDGGDNDEGDGENDNYDGEYDGSTEGAVWSGKVSNNIAEGKGTVNEPYIIKNGAELSYAIKEGGLNGSYFKLANDIYLNDVSQIWWEKNADNNRWISSDSFNGHLDGCGYIVYGIWYPDDTKRADTGLIPIFNSGSIKNIGVRYSQIRTTTNAGAIIGRTNSGGLKTVENCFSDETVTVKYTTTEYGGVAGIIGQAGYDMNDGLVLEISNCYSKAIVSGHDKNRINGIIGTAWQCNYTMSNCYSKGQPPYYAGNENTCSYLYKGGKELSEIYKNVYSDGRAPEMLEHFTFISDSESMIGDKAKTSMSGLDYSNVFEVVATSTPKLKIFTSISGEDVDISGDSIVYSGGNGSKSNPFIIKTVEQLRYLLQSVNTKGKYYSIANDIYVNDTSKSDWMSQSPQKWYTDADSEVFSGYIEGNGHIIYGIYTDEKPAQYEGDEPVGSAALFPEVEVTAVIRNIHVRSSYISSKGSAGAIVGVITEANGNKNYLQVIGCSADESVTVKGLIAGGLVGGNSQRGLKLHYCYFTGTVQANAPERGNAFVGDIWSKDWEMVQCYYIGYEPHRGTYPPSPSSANYGNVSIPTAKFVSVEQMTGVNAKTNMKELDWSLWYTVNGDTPHLKSIPADMVVKIYDQGKKGEIWSGYRAAEYARGSGTQNDPYIIETPEQLARLVDLDEDTAGKYYKLAADIYLNDVSKLNWEKDAREWFGGTNKFAGYFNGDGYVVKGMYFNTSFANAGLFQQITSGAVIEKVGISQASITNLGNDKKEAYSAALVAVAAGWDVKDYVRPRISQCFADHTVKIKSWFTGGLIGGCGMYVDMDNCYFSGSLESDNYIGQAIGNTWGNKGNSVIKNSYFISEQGAPLSQNVSAGNIELIAVYHKGEAGSLTGAIGVASMLIRGNKAKENMPLLDYNKIWQIVEGGTPVLRCFKNAAQYSQTAMPEKVEISFASNGGSACENLRGYPLYSELTLDMLPTPTRYGYEFDGWYHYPELVSPVENGLFPNFNTVFYAKWKPVGFTVDFEGELDAEFDFNINAEHYKPGVTGYSPLFTNNGFKSMHLKQAENGKAIFLLSYENTLEIGQKYDIVFNVCTDADSIASPYFRIVHAKDPQFNSDVLGYDEVKLDALSRGKWTQHKVTIVANAPYLLIETDADISLYFDDIQVTPIGEEGEVGKLVMSTNEVEVTSESIPVYIFVICGVAAVLLVAGAVAIVLVIKKRKI